MKTYKVRTHNLTAVDEDEYETITCHHLEIARGVLMFTDRLSSGDKWTRIINKDYWRTVDRIETDE
jgi:hypothetical protein